jgi:aliphatic nitrilase
MRERLPYTEEDRVFLSNAENGGGSSIIGADSMILAGPMSGAEEGLLIAELDLEDCVRAKLVHDYSGHYNRPDVFTLTVNRSVPVYVDTSAALKESAEQDLARPGPEAAAADDQEA